jgi:signal transduction histidine kinase
METSLQFYTIAIDLAETLNDVPPYCIAMGNSGIVYADLGEKEKAIACSENAIARVKNQTNKHFELSIYQMAGRVYQVVKYFEKADYWFTVADRLYNEMGKAVDNFELYKYWAETLNEMNRPQEAYEKLTRFIKQKEDLHVLNKQAELNDASLRFHYEEGKKEQDLLKKKNSEIEQYAHRLEMSNFELKQFAHVASHDMKEPLRMITNYSQLLEKSLNGHLKIDQKDYIYYINDGAKRMMNVIEDLLQLSKINSSQKKEIVNMNEILDGVKLALKPDIDEKNALIKSTPLPSLFADKVHLTQLLQNLISNAIKYNQSSNPEIEICYRMSPQHSHYFEIADNGIGIAPQYRDKVFIIFQRLHNRNEFDGTGIGLAICKKIIDSLNGKIWIEDSPLGGTKFCFTIPQ